MSDVEYTLAKRTILNHNTFSIELVSQTTQNFPVSSFLYIYNHETRRPYTPIAVHDNKIVLAIKKYPHGNLSNYLYNVDIGAVIQASLPVVKKEYKKEYRDVLMIAGGTGITPMLQILRHDSTANFLVIFCNLTESDIFLQDLLDKHKNARVVHVIQNKDEKKEDTKDREIVYGLINKNIIADLAVVEGNILYDFVYVCGPPAFMEAVCGRKAPDMTQGKLQGMLKELKFDKDKVYKF